MNEEIWTFKAGKIIVSGTEEQMIDLAHLIWEGNLESTLSDAETLKELSESIAYALCGE